MGICLESILVSPVHKDDKGNQKDGNRVQNYSKNK